MLQGWWAVQVDLTDALCSLPTGPEPMNRDPTRVPFHFISHFCSPGYHVGCLSSIPLPPCCSDWAWPPFLHHLASVVLKTPSRALSVCSLHTCLLLVPIYFHLIVTICIMWVCMYLCGFTWEGNWACMCIYMQGRGPKLKLCISLAWIPLSFLRQSLSLTLELTISSHSSSQLPLPSAQISGSCCACSAVLCGFCASELQWSCHYNKCFIHWSFL